MDIWERIRFARDNALKAEEAERQRLADAETEELQRAASARMATRQSVREALDDVLGEHSEPKKGKSTALSSGTESSGHEPPPPSPSGSDSEQAPSGTPGAEQPVATSDGSGPSDTEVPGTPSVAEPEVSVEEDPAAQASG